MKSLVLSAIVLTGIVLFTPLAFAVERNVPSEYATIQAAINASTNGDVVIIATGTYTGDGNRDIDFLGKAITVRSTDSLNPDTVAATIVDCQNVYGHRGFYFHSGENTNSILSGLTIRNGYADQGGGIYCSGSSPIITYCTITGNRTKDGYTELQGEDDGGEGGGIYCYNSSAKILKCTIINNQTGNGGTSIRGEGGDGGNGGGIYCWNYSTPFVTEINDCLISNNITGNGSDGASLSLMDPYMDGGGNGGSGGGIYLSYNAPAQITNCIISDNQTGNGGAYYDYRGFDASAGNGGGGGGIHNMTSSPTIKNCLLINNKTGSGGNCSSPDQAGNGGSGGGINCSYSSPGIVNCTIVSNQTGPGGTSTNPGMNGTAGTGGGIYCSSGTNVTNGIIRANIADSQIQGSSNVTYSDVQDGYSGTGNINTDPLFVAGPLGNYYLSQVAAGQASNSPCVDAGSDTSINLGMNLMTTRTDGFGDAGTVDMGYHYLIDSGSPVERNVPSVYATIQAAINASSNGDVVIIAPGTYTGTGNKDLDFAGRAITVRSTNPADPCVVAATVIDCQSSGRGFYFHSGEGSYSIISGLTIKRGYVTGNPAMGGGIYCTGSSPTIKNCIINSNGAYGPSGSGNGKSAYGGGVYCASESHPAIIDCNISNNIAQGGTGGDQWCSPMSGCSGSWGSGGHGYGGGIYADSNLTIAGCLITGNSAIGGTGGVYYETGTPFQGKNGGVANGGGICSSGNSFIKDCTVTENRADGGDGGLGGADFGNHGSGGGIYCSGSNAAIKNCLITNNESSGGNGGNSYDLYTDGGYGGNGIGGGLACSSGATIGNCTINDNNATGGLGGSSHGIPPTPIFNGGSQGDGIYGVGTTVITNCILWGNGNDLFTCSATYSCISNTDDSGTGNIHSNPLFVAGPLGNYYLSQIAAGQAVDSPCVNAGSDTSINLGMNLTLTRTDSFLDIGILDMGYHYPPVVNPDLNGDAFVNFLDYSILSMNWQQVPDPCDPSSGDIMKDSWVDIFDLAGLCSDWLNCFVTKATDPVPADHAINVSRNVILQWSAGNNTISHDVYFGTNFNAVNNADITSSTVYMGNQDANFWDINNYAPAGLDFNATFYWRIDEAAGCIAKGDVWSFNTILLLPGQAGNPTPGNGLADVSITNDLSWTAGSDATSHDVYFGTANPPQPRGNQTGTTYDTGTMDTNTTYYWQINEKNSDGTTTGEIWSFTTSVILPGQAGNPAPGNGVTDIYITTDLSWTAGSLATSHDVYFGTTNPPQPRGNQIGTTYDAGTMDINTTYYWQIDEKNASGTTTGNVWSFTTGSVCEVDDANLVAWWTFDEGTGTTAYDSAGSNNGNLINNPSWIAGKIGGALSFDGVNDYIQVPDSSSLDVTSTFTFAFWIYVDETVTPGGCIISKDGSGDTSWAYNVYLSYGGVGSVGYETNNRFPDVYTGSNYFLSGDWNHVAITFDNSDSPKMRIYINGNEKVSGSPPAPSALSTYLMIGRRGASPDSYYFNSALDDVRIYNRALTEVEVMMLSINEHIKAFRPNPANRKADVAANVTLNWSPGAGALTHDVYFGTSYNDVNVAIQSSSEFMGNKDVNYWDTNNYAPAGLDLNTSYYWRIDEVNATSTAKGDIWSFTTVPPLPGQASNPAPGNGATNIALTTDLSWTAGSNATSHDVYFGTANPPQPRGNQTDTTYDTGAMVTNTTYYWRIDEKNTGGTTTGVVWSFTTSEIDSTLVGWWKFDEGSGLTAYDSAGNSNGILRGTPDWVAGKVGNYALDFNGTGDFVEVNDSPSLDIDSAITIAAWIRLNNLSKTYTIAAKQPTNSAYPTYPGNYMFSTSILTGKLSFSHETGSENASYSSDSGVTSGIWHHVAVTLGNSLVTFYIDGVSAGQFGQAGTFGLINNEPVRIGTRKNNTFYFNGSMDDVRIYNRFLTADEIGLLWQQGQ